MLRGEEGEEPLVRSDVQHGGLFVERKIIGVGAVVEDLAEHGEAVGVGSVVEPEVVLPAEEVEGAAVAEVAEGAAERDEHRVLLFAVSE